MTPPQYVVFVTKEGSHIGSLVPTTQNHKPTHYYREIASGMSWADATHLVAVLLEGAKHRDTESSGVHSGTGGDTERKDVLPERH